jgi:nucleoside-diphosphate-sugar epimerase
MTQGRQTREFNYVEDIVDGIVRAVTVPGTEGELLNLGCGQVRTGGPPTTCHRADGRPGSGPRARQALRRSWPRDR